MTVPPPSPSPAPSPSSPRPAAAAALPDTNFHLWEPLPCSSPSSFPASAFPSYPRHHHDYHHQHHRQQQQQQQKHQQQQRSRPPRQSQQQPPPSLKGSERSSTRSSLDIVTTTAQYPLPAAAHPKRRSLNNASSADSNTTTGSSTTAVLAPSSNRPQAAAAAAAGLVKRTPTKHEHDPRDEVEARALRKLARPPKAPRPSLKAAPQQPEQPTLLLSTAPSGPTLAPYHRRGRSISAASMTSSDDGDADVLDSPAAAAAVGRLRVAAADGHPSAFSSSSHSSSDRLQTQIRIIETIDQLKHDASLAMSRLTQGTGTEEDAAAARFTYAKYLVENIRHLEAGQKVHLDEGMGLLKALSREGHADAQFMYASLLITGVPGSQTRHRPDYEQAFPLYLTAAKQGHADACYHAALCYEHGRGTGAPPDPVSAVKKFRKAAIAHHPGAMYRLGMILATGELGQHRNITASVKWLNLSARFATAKHPHALYQLALLHENDPLALNGRADPDTALELLRRAADLGHVLSQVRLGHLYQFGDLGAPVDPGSSIRYYSLAAQKGSAEAMYELSAWHFTGAEDPVDGSVILPPNDQEAYIWARKAAEKGLPKAEYAVGFYTESAVGVPQDMDEALGWYTIAATHGDDHAIARLKGSDPTSPADPTILAAVADVDGDNSSIHCDSHAGKMRREGLNRLYTVRAYKRLKNTVLERRNLRKAGGL
ncbi:hypothetical protein HDU90_000738 [Geranomyces variabilis]|nr:hypothetical protein HDU90_000738 [Geranomyces variabilis]